jgi:hypothetical protein
MRGEWNDRLMKSKKEDKYADMATYDIYVWMPVRQLLMGALA